MALTWKDWVKQAVGTGGTGALTLGAAASGYQAFAAGDDGKLFSYSIVDGTAWETGLGTYTSSGTSFARTSRTASSTGSALNVSTSAYVMVDLNTTTAGTAYIGGVGVTPGGRLTLESGVPVSTTDQVAKTTVYYTPYVSNVITLWDGNAWLSVEFAELSLALGTITSALPYDVFGYLSSGAAALEKLAWTSATARATAVTLQDGRYCKSGDKTRLYLGTFYTTSTTTTEDSYVNTSQSGSKRFLWNMYNRRKRIMGVIDTTNSWSYTTGTTRQANAAAGNKVEFCLGMAEDEVYAQAITPFFSKNATGVGYSGCGLDSTTTFSFPNAYAGSGTSTNDWRMISGHYAGVPAVGYHYISWNEDGGGTTGTSTFIGDDGGTKVQAGLTGWVLA